MSEHMLGELEGTLPDGRRVRRIALDNGTLSAAVLDFGAGLQDLRLVGGDLSLALGSPDAAAYGGIMSMFGTVVGPVANRIGGATAQIDGETLTFEANEHGRTTLHSASAGTHTKTWDIAEHSADAVTLRLELADGEGGLPGHRVLTSRYALVGDTLEHELTGTTDRPTLMNLAHHGFWTTQAPHGWGGQRLTIHADAYLPVTDETLPTGEIRPVEGTEFDFRAPRRLDVATVPDLDHNFCLARSPGPLRPALRLESDETGLALEIETTAPGLQIFGMHKFSVEDDRTIHGHPYPRHAALAIEPQMWPDAPGRDDWPDITLRPHETFRQISRYRVLRG